MLRIAYEGGKISSVPKIRVLKEPPARKGFLEIRKFEELLAALPAHLGPLILFLYWCGVRLGEALQIEWPQVDLAGPLIRLEEDQTKNSEARIVPLLPVLVGILGDVEPKIGRVFDAATSERNGPRHAQLLVLVKWRSKRASPALRGISTVV